MSLFVVRRPRWLLSRQNSTSWQYGVAKIQIEDEPAVPGQYQISKLKVVGWYVAALVSPSSPDSAAAEQ